MPKNFQNFIFSENAFKTLIIEYLENFKRIHICKIYAGLIKS